MEEKKEEKKEEINVRKVHGRDEGVRLERVLFVPSRGRGRRRKKKRGAERSKVRYTKARQGLGRWGRWLLLLFVLGQSMLGVSAAAEG